MTLDRCVFTLGHHCGPQLSCRFRVLRSFETHRWTEGDQTVCSELLVSQCGSHITHSYYRTLAETVQCPDLWLCCCVLFWFLFSQIINSRMFQQETHTSSRTSTVAKHCNSDRLGQLHHWMLHYWLNYLLRLVCCLIGYLLFHCPTYYLYSDWLITFYTCWKETNRHGDTERRRSQTGSLRVLSSGTKWFKSNDQWADWLFTD